MITKVARNDTIYREVVNEIGRKERYQVVFLKWIDEATEGLPITKQQHVDAYTATHAAIYDTKRLVIDKVNKDELFREVFK